ncbi:cytochrome P450 6A1 [Ophiocordyceps camponoti-floridani]|uniref:Cytochrome P450 6A1 n=1 Tax=Ophiocordyceps camponoti-floridani TaxID=2030778 RepID=A0A8H4Q7W4_9HYPO|nr:cytochrome P450 6A1 [Ophiocordyceps camponoti-floridani]
MALTLLLIGLAPLAAAIVILVQMVSSRPVLPPDAPREVRGWPLVGCVDFFRRRRDFLLWGSRIGPGRQFSFFYGPHPIVAVSGPEARASFFNARGLDLGAGFAGLYAASPTIEHLPEGNVSGNFMSLAKRLLHRDRLEAVLPTMITDADTALATTEPIMEPFSLMLRLVYKLTHRTLGSNDVADDEGLLEETLAVFGKLDQSSAVEIMFPGLFTPNKLRKMLAGLKLHRLINSTFNAAWILVYLGTDADWYGRIRSEVDDSIARHRLANETPAKTLTRLSLSDWESDFPLVELAMRETIRLIGRGVCMRKNVSGSDVEIGTSGCVIPRGAYAVCGLEDAHMDEGLYPDADRWDPDRYACGREAEKQGPHDYLGWGSGLHPCLGMRFAKLEIIITTVTTFAHYDFHRCDEHGERVSLPLPGLVRSSIGEKRPEHDVFLRLGVS